MITDDAVDEIRRELHRDLHRGQPGHRLPHSRGGWPRYVVTITDDDTAGVTVTAANPLAVVEGGSNTYTVRLDSQPTQDVTITPASGDAGAATV